MKKYILFILTLAFSSGAFAGNLAHLKVNISSPINNKAYYVCVGNTCFNLKAGQHGKVFPLETGPLNGVLLADMSVFKLAAQSLPSSCHIDVNEGQTLTISGHLTVKGHTVSLRNLNCLVG